MRTLAIGALVASFSFSPLAAAAAQQWLDGTIAYSYTTNCISGQTEVLTDAYVGYWGDSNASFPAVGDVYYLQVVVADMGNPCSGGSYANIEAVLPPNTQLAVSASTPVRCFLGDIGGTLTEDPAECPQNPSQGTHGLQVNPTVSPYMWPLAHGKMAQVWIPVYSTAPMSGMATNSYFTAWVQSNDGLANPVTTPQQGVFVAANPPAVDYATPSATKLTTTTAHLEAYLYNHFASGTGYFDWGLSTAYGNQDPVAIPNTYNSMLAYDDLSGLSPSTTYHWRFRFVDSAGAAYSGVDQSFTTAASTGGTTYALSLQPIADGAVSVSPSGYVYAPGTLVTLTATPASGYDFAGWTVDSAPAGAANPTTLTMNADHLVGASFTPSAPVNSGIDAGPDAGGAASDAGGLAADGGGSGADAGQGADGGARADGGKASTGRNPASGCGCGSTASGAALLGLVLIALLRRSRAPRAA